MADKMMRIAGRTNGGVAVPMLVDSNGNVSTVRTWKKEWVTIQSALEIRDTNEHSLDAIDVSGIPLFSLRILNRLGVPITIKFSTDANTFNGYKLADNNGTPVSITIQYTNDYVIITPNDLPFLNYIKYLRMTVTAESVPASGTFEAHMVKIC